MTETQMAKAQWLNRLYYIKMKMESLYSLKENDKNYGDKLLKMLGEDSDKNVSQQVKAALMCNYDRTEEKYLIAIKQYNAVREEIENAIEKIDDYEYQAILTAHYIENKTWNVIATENYYGLRTIKYKHIKALDSLEISIGKPL